MRLERLEPLFTVCKVKDISAVDLNAEWCFLSKTDEEISVVCPMSSVPMDTLDREDGWKAFRISGILDFSLIGILAGISKILAEHQIGIFVVSTYNTDYILIKEPDFEKALLILAKKGYEIK